MWYVDYINEDLLIAAYGTPMLNIVPINIALKLAFESGYEWCLEKIKGKISFGCHAWEKYDFKKWMSIIERYGYSVESQRQVKEYVINFTKTFSEFCSRKFIKDEIGKFLPTSYENRKEGVYIWGAGYWGISFMHKLIEAAIPIAGFIDSDKNKYNKKILSYEIHETKKY